MRDIAVIAIDDDSVDLETLRRHLSRTPTFHVDFMGYDDWSTGLEALDQRPADVIFLDYFLGNMTGTELLREIRDPGGVDARH